MASGDIGEQKEPAAEWVALDDLTPWADNPRRNESAVKPVLESIRRFGFGAPIVARRADGQVIAGHTRLKAARLLGLDRVPVRYLDLDPADARLLALADNRLGEIAEWNESELARVIEELKSDGADLDGCGWSEEEIEAYTVELPPPVDSDDLQQRGKGQSRMNRNDGARDVIGFGKWMGAADKELVEEVTEALNEACGEQHDAAAVWLCRLVLAHIEEAPEDGDGLLE